jgi:osmotically-inducible protein OsmY
MQTNRQTENRAQYGMRMDLAAFQGASSNGAASGTPGSTIQVRTAVERSVASVVPSGANVTMDGSNAILSGMVSSEHDRKLVERMALLVPGVQAVRNELVVQVTSPTKL